MSINHNNVDNYRFERLFNWTTSVGSCVSMFILFFCMTTIASADDRGSRADSNQKNASLASGGQQRSGDSADAQLKRPAIGLIDRNRLPKSEYSAGGNVGTFVAMVYWKDLQPTPGAPIANNNAIDRAIADARTLTPAGKVKIRLMAGIHAPDWAKRLDGEPFEIYDSVDETEPTSAPRWWTTKYAAAYEDLQLKLAARYDLVPEVREITISLCMSVYAEPFMRNAADERTRQALLDAGFTAAEDRTCLADSISQHQVWQHTRSSMAFNPYQQIDSVSSWYPDEDFSELMMDRCRAVLGQRCVLENNSVRSPIDKLGPLYARMYAKFKAMGPPITYQTAVPDRIGCLITDECESGQVGVLEWAIANGATGVELPNGYETRSPETLAPYDTQLRNNWRNRVSD